MIRINLLPVKAAQKKERLKSQLVVVALSVLVTLGLCGLAYMQMLTWVEDARARITSYNVCYTKLLRTDQV